MTMRARLSAGFTLLESLLALAVGTLTMLAGVAFLGQVQRNYRVQVEWADLHQRAAFAMSMLQRAVRIAGYRNVDPATGAVIAPARDRWPALRVRGSCAGDADACRAAPRRSALLEVSHHGSGLAAGARSAEGLGDGSVLDCAGRRVPGPKGRADVSRSTFFVARADDGVPALFCRYADATGTYRAQALVEGVEAMHIRLGVAAVGRDDVALRWIPAAELSDNALPAVRRVAVALVLRGGGLRGRPASATQTLEIFDAAHGGVQRLQLRQARPYRLRAFFFVVTLRNRWAPDSGRTPA
ncbi:transmembrane protein [Pandoraea terrae]|uniref:Transmembrane protein n=2 Tax=Pandoraea terrae TaxID=1537710 RepID=A0A5E4UN15_9BURK|nr:transmembrane protein [Pandoraea terrae]